MMCGDVVSDQYILRGDVHYKCMELKNECLMVIQSDQQQISV